MTRNDTHDLDPTDVDELDEISGDQQLSLVWCDTHGVYEWHWLPRRRRPSQTS